MLNKKLYSDYYTTGALNSPSEEKHVNLTQDSLCPSLDSKLAFEK
jgi:hypothetical protein